MNMNSIAAFKTGIERVEVLSTPSMEETNASVKVSGKMFVLLTRIYSRPLEAGVREIVNNAIDANIEAGRADEPVVVKIPRTWDTMFSVRDHGLGMSHDFMMNRYMRLGDSTKELDADQTGFWGIGSKSPLAITDQYWVTCFQGGEKRIYSITRKTFDEKDGSYDTIPVIGLVAQMPTDEPDGVEVSWAIDTDNQFSSLEQAVRLVIAGTRGKANIIIERDGEVVHDYDFTVEPTHQGATWELYPNGYVSQYANQFGRNGAMIRVGRILYNLNINAVLAGRNTSEARNQTIQRLFKENAIIEVPVSAVRVAPSREDLEYTPSTCKAVYDAASAILDEITTEATLKISSAATYYDATAYFMKWNNDSRLGSFLGHIEWKGKKLNAIGIEVPDDFDYQLTDVVSIKVGGFSFRPVSAHRRRTYSYNRYINPTMGDIRVFVTLWNDKRCRHTVARVRSYIEDQGLGDYTNILWVRVDEEDIVKCSDMISKLDLPPGVVVNVWDLPDAPKTPVAPRAKKPKVDGAVFARMFRLAGTRLVSDYRDLNTITDAAYVIISDDAKVTSINQYVKLASVHPIKSIIPKSFVLDVKQYSTVVEVYFIRESEYNRVVPKASPGWESIFDLFEKKISEFDISEDEFISNLDYQALRSGHSEIGSMIVNSSTRLGGFEPLVDKIVEVARSAKSLNGDKYFGFDNLNGYLGGKYVRADHQNLKSNVEDVIRDLRAKYPDIGGYASLYAEVYNHTSRCKIINLATSYMRLINDRPVP